MAQLICCVKVVTKQVELFCDKGNSVYGPGGVPTDWVGCGSSEVRVVDVSEFAVGGTANWEKRPKGGAGTGSKTTGTIPLEDDSTNACP